jgi:hypothetical protein
MENLLREVGESKRLISAGVFGLHSRGEQVECGLCTLPVTATPHSPGFGPHVTRQSGQSEFVHYRPQPGGCSFIR